MIISADDFGLSLEVNDAIEIAHTHGLLTTASLMVAGAAAADAVARAKRLPGLQVGLHLVVIEGRAVSPAKQIPLLLDHEERFASDQLRLGMRYFFRSDVRRQLACEIAAQFEAFAATGLALDHANAHKHMHLHPTVGRLLIDIGRRHGLRAIRIPFEPPAPLAAADGTRDTPAAAALRAWTRLLRGQAQCAGMRTNDCCFGLSWSGAMTTERVTELAAHLPPGLSEIYFHPAASRGPLLARLMPDYAHEAELATLCAPSLRQALARAGIRRIGWNGADAD